jgi:hypothetical protein
MPHLKNCSKKENNKKFFHLVANTYMCIRNEGVYKTSNYIFVSSMYSLGLVVMLLLDWKKLHDIKKRTNPGTSPSSIGS